MKDKYQTLIGSNAGCRDTGHHLNRAKWKVWHGNLYEASIPLSRFYDGVDTHVMTAGADSVGRTGNDIRRCSNLDPAAGRSQLPGPTLSMRSQLTAHASQAVRTTGEARPPTLREIQ